MNRTAPMKQRSVPLSSIMPSEEQSDGFIDLDRLVAAVFRRARLVAAFVVLFIALGPLISCLPRPITRR